MVLLLMTTTSRGCRDTDSDLSRGLGPHPSVGEEPGANIASCRAMAPQMKNNVPLVGIAGDLLVCLDGRGQQREVVESSRGVE